MKKMRTIRAGELILFSTGVYSDYDIDGAFRAVRDIDPEAERDAWLAEYPDQREAYEFKEGYFLAWIARRGLIDPVDYVEWHLGDYRTVSDMDLWEGEKWRVQATKEQET